MKNKEPILVLFGNNVRVTRRMRKLSQEKLAELCGLHRTYIGMIERAEKNVSLSNIQRIAQALNVSIETLLK